MPLLQYCCLFPSQNCNYVQQDYKPAMHEPNIHSMFLTLLYVNCWPSVSLFTSPKINSLRRNTCERTSKTLRNESFQKPAGCVHLWFIMAVSSSSACTMCPCSPGLTDSLQSLSSSSLMSSCVSTIWASRHYDDLQRWGWWS